MREMPEEIQVGPRLRALRERKGLSLRALAELSGISSNAISMIERGLNSPTVSSLRRLASALEIPITAFFSDETEQMTVFHKRGERSRSRAECAVLEHLGAGLSEQRLEPFLVIVDPSGGDTAGAYGHSGEEWVYCLEGRAEYRVGDRLYTMEPGDSLLFKADQPHSFRNLQDTTTQLLIVLGDQTLEEREVSRQVHLRF